MTNNESDSGNTTTRTSRSHAPLIVVTLLVLAGGMAGWLAWRAQANELAGAQGALELQVLASRLGAAAIEAEYENYAAASELASGVFDGVVNFGIERSELPENYARVLGARDEVIVGLAQNRPEVTARLVELFFLLQLPAETELDSRYIIPATGSGLGMVPPIRRDVRVLPPDTTRPSTESNSDVERLEPEGAGLPVPPLMPDTIYDSVPGDRIR